MKSVYDKRNTKKLTCNGFQDLTATLLFYPFFILFDSR